MAGGNRHTQFPASPTRLLATTVTDTQMAQLFATDHHRAHAYNTINHWGRGVSLPCFFDLCQERRPEERYVSPVLKDRPIRQPCRDSQRPAGVTWLERCLRVVVFIYFELPPT